VPTSNIQTLPAEASFSWHTLHKIGQQPRDPLSKLHARHHKGEHVSLPDLAHGAPASDTAQIKYLAHIGDALARAGGPPKTQQIATKARALSNPDRIAWNARDTHAQTDMLLNTTNLPNQGHVITFMNTTTGATEQRPSTTLRSSIYICLLTYPRKLASVRPGYQLHRNPA
jgi:hypothetical protein